MKKEVILFNVEGEMVNSPEAFRLFTLEVFQKIKSHGNNKSIIILVVSAFGEMTQMIKEIIAILEHGDEGAVDLKMREFDTYLLGIVGREIIDNDFPEGKKQLNLFKSKVLLYRASPISDEMNAELQQFGEMISSKILEDILKSQSNYKKDEYVKFLDTRDFIKTKESLLSGVVEIHLTKERFDGCMRPFVISDKGNVIICPGYIAKSAEGKSSLLNKKGSGYTAAIIAYFVERLEGLNLSEVVFFDAFSGISLDLPGTVSKIEPYVTWDEVEKLVSAGAKVLHPLAVSILKKMRQPVLVTSLENFLTSRTSTIIHSK